MQHIASERISWKKAMKSESPLILPVAHDALTARIIEQAGFSAVQIGGFAVEGSRHGVPDIDLTHLAERYAAVKDIMGATSLPIMVDGDDGYGDAKNVTYTVRAYEGLGVQALFLEDQKAPKECGHMDNKKVVPVDVMVNKIKAAVDARSGEEFFILARTDSINPEGLDSALSRGEKYLKAGADGIYVEGPQTVEQLEAIGKAVKGAPLGHQRAGKRRENPVVTPQAIRRDGVHDDSVPDFHSLSKYLCHSACCCGPSRRTAPGLKI
jgi:2-methylisocitrate lyase-like PEP mutase family enzyme